jgi:hypothetical protein
MKTPNLQTKIISQNCKRVKQNYNLYKIAKLQKIKYKKKQFFYIKILEFICK